MAHTSLRSRRCRVTAALAASLLLAAFVSDVRAQTATQTITLVEGWNAVWLEVEPTYPANHPTKPGEPMHPEDAFSTATNTSISIIVTPNRLVGLAEFSGDLPTSESDTFNRPGWEHWRRNDAVADNNLVMTFGNRPYLIKVVGAAPGPFGVAGRARFFRPQWVPDRFNLVGFGIDASAAPSFETFFQPSGGRHPFDEGNPTAPKIYRLVAATGAWQPVAKADPILNDTAYWIYSAGPSDYMGPVAVDFDQASTGRLHFGSPDDAVEVLEQSGSAVAGSYDLEEVVLTNLNDASATPSLSRLFDDSVVLTETKPDPDSLAHRKAKATDLSSSYAFDDAIPAGVSGILTFGADARRAWGAPAERTNLYRLKTGGGNEVYLPVSAVNSSLPPSSVPAPAALAVTGLWVGEVSYNSATSIVEAGAPARPTAGSIPMRVLLHSDTNGMVRLLNQVTIMQSRTADPAIAPVPVLVVDPLRIPFFEGIKERNGRRVGLRLQSVGYDMPRKTELGTQDDAGFLQLIVNESANPGSAWAFGLGQYPSAGEIDEAAITSFLTFRAIRPPGLKEDYHLSWPLQGALGPGQTLSSSGGTAGPLTLDPFHRSNPFRHAFHKQHSKGPSITREITLTFNATQDVADRLGGTFTETIRGLINQDLILSGAIQMQRVSSVDSLDGITP